MDRATTARASAKLIIAAVIVPLALGLIYISWNEASTFRVTGIEIDPKRPNVVYATVSEEGVYKSVDDGATWTAINSGLTKSNYYYGLDRIDAHRWFSHIDLYGTWTHATVYYGLTNVDARTIVVDPQDPNSLYLGTDGDGIYRSTDAGVYWERMNNSLLRDCSINALVIDPLSRFMYAGTDKGIYMSGDEGQSWSVGGLPRYYTVNVLAVDPEFG